MFLVVKGSVDRDGEFSEDVSRRREKRGREDRVVVGSLGEWGSV